MPPKVQCDPLEVVMAMVYGVGDGAKELRYVGRLSACTAKIGPFEAAYTFVRYEPPANFAKQVRRSAATTRTPLSI